MKEEELVNEEIKRLLSLNTSPPITNSKVQNTEEGQNNNIAELLELFKELNITHDNIRNNLEENKIDSSAINIKIINLIKNIISERKGKEEEVKSKQKKINELESKLEQIERQITKESNNLKFKESSANELNRIIKDQSERIKGYKEKYENEKKNIKIIKALNEELSAVNDKILKKNENLENELKVFEEYLNAKDKTIKEMQNEKNECEKLVENLKKEGKELIGQMDKLKNKIIDKNEGISILHSELASLISKDKRRDKENEEFKEKANYYERLYKSVNKQNEYLNDQLNKLINIKNIEVIRDEQVNESKNETLNEDLNQQLEKLKLNERKNKKNLKYKIKKCEKAIDIKERENLNLRNEITDNHGQINALIEEVKRLREVNEQIDVKYREMSDNLFTKIEELMKENKKRQEIIFELKKENLKRDNITTGKTEQIFTPKEEYNFKYDLKEKDYDHKSILNKQDSTDYLSFDDNQYKDELKQMKAMINNDKITELLKPKEMEKEFMFYDSKDYKIPEKKKYESEDFYVKNNYEGKKKIGDYFTQKDDEYFSKYNDQEKNYLNEYENNEKNFLKEYKSRKNNMVDDFFDANNYEQRKNADDIPKDYFTNKEENKDLKNLKIREDFQKDDNMKKYKYHDYKADLFDNKINEQLNKLGDYRKYKSMKEEKHNQVENSFNDYKNDNIKHEVPENVFGADSSFSSLKNVEIKPEIKESNLSTTSSLKNMITKTDKLKERFDELEYQLDQIKNSNKDAPEKVKEQIKAFDNFYFSEAFDMNDPDVL